MARGRDLLHELRDEGGAVLDRLDRLERGIERHAELHLLGVLALVPRQAGAVEHARAALRRGGVNRARLHRAGARARAHVMDRAWWANGAARDLAAHRVSPKRAR